MSELVARTGRHHQRYEAGFRLIAGCIPFKYKNSVQNNGDTSEKVVEVLMINSTSGPGLLFPKGGWENDETVEEAALREALEEAGVRGDLLAWHIQMIPSSVRARCHTTSADTHCVNQDKGIIVLFHNIEAFPGLLQIQKQNTPR